MLADYPDAPGHTKVPDGQVPDGQGLADLPFIQDEEVGLKDSELQALTIHADSAEMLSFYDKQLSDGTVRFHPWQIKVNKALSNLPASDKHPLKFVLCAANGSGKDSFIVAPFAVFMSLSSLKCTVVITSSSGPQLTTQTERYIRNLCEKINKFWNNKIFKINQRNIKCLLTGSEIILFATDEAGRAEGYHPIEPGAKLVLIANECKSVKDDIFSALGRCTGYTHYLMVSSPGELKGDFYWAYTHWPNTFRVTSKDCPHLSEEDRAADAEKYGINSAYYRSKHEALFTSIGGTVVISEDTLDKCLTLCKLRIGEKWPKEVGIDLAAGGDECVISIWQGNKRVYRYCFIERDTTVTAEIISRELKAQGISKDSGHIKADDGGIGRGIIDNLRKMGWNIRRIMNQTPAFDKKAYGNKGAEMWYNVKRLVEECLILWGEDELDDRMDQKTRNQLVSRHYKQTEGGNNRIFLQSKQDAKAEGHPSPDRADADILALSDYRVDQLLNADKKVVEETPKEKVVSLEQIVKDMDNKRFDVQEEMALKSFANIRDILKQHYPELVLEDDPEQMALMYNQAPKTSIPGGPAIGNKLIYGSLMAALDSQKN